MDDEERESDLRSAGYICHTTQANATPFANEGKIRFPLPTRVSFGSIFGGGEVARGCVLKANLYEPLSKLLVSPLISPIVVPYIIPI